MWMALRMLGYNCYHMIEAMKNPRRDLNLWADAMESEFFGGKAKPYGREEFDKLFGDYDVRAFPLHGGALVAALSECEKLRLTTSVCLFRPLLTCRASSSSTP